MPEGRAARAESKPAQDPVRSDSDVDKSQVHRAELWLLLVFLIANVGTLTGSFLLDDLPIIVKNARLHSLSQLGEIWTHGYWPDRPGLTLYRPVTQTMWSLVWTVGGGQPWLFHAVNLVLGAAVAVLVHRLLLDLRLGSRVAFIAALLFAVLPIHTE